MLFQFGQKFCLVGLATDTKFLLIDRRLTLVVNRNLLSLQLVFGQSSFFAWACSHEATDLTGSIHAAVGSLVDRGPEAFRPQHRLASLLSLFQLSLRCRKALLHVHLRACETVLPGKHVFRLFLSQGAVVHCLRVCISWGVVARRWPSVG